MTVRKATLLKFNDLNNVHKLAEFLLRFVDRLVQTGIGNSCNDYKNIIYTLRVMQLTTRDFRPLRVRRDGYKEPWRSICVANS